MTTMNTLTTMTVADTQPGIRGARRDIECGKAGLIQRTGLALRKGLAPQVCLSPRKSDAALPATGHAGL